jgi:hypothetical protein
MTGGASNVRIHRRSSFPDGNFVQLPNETVRNPRLSLRARAILASVLSRPSDWRTSAERIAAEGPDGIFVVRKALRELRDHGYLRYRVVRGPRGRLTTDLHFYDIPAGDTGCSSAGSRSTEAPVTGAPVTGAPDTEAPDTGKPGTGQSVSSRSLQRPSTKTRTNTVKENRSLSLGEMLRSHLPDMADAERERFAEFMASGCSDGRKRRAYLRTIIANGDLPAQLAEFRGDAAPAGQKPPAAGIRQGPPCPHGVEGGAEIMPTSGKPWCPMCRIEAPAGQT